LVDQEKVKIFLISIKENYKIFEKNILLRGLLVNQVVGEIIAHQAEDSSLIWKDEQPQRN